MFDEKDLVIEAKHVTRRFPTNDGRELTACNDVNLKMYRGKTLGLVGESGCGKSPFMRFLVWLDRPSEGEILFHGKDITKLKGKELWEERQHIQMVFQDPSTSFNPKMKIRDIICEPLMNFGRIKASEKDAKARELLELVDLPGDFADRLGALAACLAEMDEENTERDFEQEDESMKELRTLDDREMENVSGGLAPAQPVMESAIKKLKKAGKDAELIKTIRKNDDRRKA